MISKYYQDRIEVTLDALGSGVISYGKAQNAIATQIEQAVQEELEACIDIVREALVRQSNHFEGPLWPIYNKLVARRKEKEKEKEKEEGYTVNVPFIVLEKDSSFYFPDDDEEEEDK